MKKRIASLLLVLVMALSLIPTTVWADNTTQDTSTEGADAEDTPVEVSTFDELKAAVDAENSTIVLTADIDLTAPLLIDSATADITIRSKEDENFTLKRADDFTSYAINVKDGGKLTLENITLDGNGEVVQSNYPFIYMKTTEVKKQTDSELNLKFGATIQNCVTKNNASSYGGAIYSAGSVYMYEGSAITNCSSQGGGAIRLSYTTSSTSGLEKFANFTMYGGTISGCSATGTDNTFHGGGALYAYGNVKVNLLGGVIEKNTSAANGGGVYVQPYKYNGYINTATVNLAGTTIRDNTAAKRGGGVYFNGDTRDVITASGVTNITGNTGKNGTDNVYLVAGRTLVDNGLADGSAIGVSGPNVPSLLVTGTNVNSGCFTADRVDAKLVPTEGGLQLEAKDVHEHCICGRTDCKETGAGHEKLIYRGVSSPELITTKGNYFLMNDAQLTNSSYSWTAPAGVTLCLDGHTFRKGGYNASTAIVVASGNTFNLTDCGSTGKVTSGYVDSKGKENADSGTGVSVAKNATFNLYGGTISGNIGGGDKTAAGGVVVDGTFNMYGGALTNNYRYTSSGTWATAVLVNAGGTFNLVDGLISGNATQDSEYGNTSTIARNGGAVYVKGGTFNMSGGSITKNTAGSYYSPSDGGGVYVTNEGTFTMSGGEISGNSASRNGGGVYVANGTFTMSGQARVTDNEAHRTYTNDFKTYSGGGVYVAANGTFTMNDSATVDANKAECTLTDVSAKGGGVYVENGGVFTMNDQAAVKDNKITRKYTSETYTTAFGGGIYVDGTLNLNGGSVTGNAAFIRGGGIYVDSKATVNLGTGTVTVQDNTIHDGDFTENVYLTGETKIQAEKAPAKDTSIGISVPLSRAIAGSAVITNATKDIKADDARFPRDISAINLERSGDDLLVTLAAHKHGAVTYTPVERLSDIKGSGNYYLVQDSTMTSQLTVAAGTTVSICLNGHKSAATNIVNNGTLTITDCQHDSANPGYLTSNYNVAITNKNAAAKLTLNSVTVKDAKSTVIDVDAEDTETRKSGGSTINLLNSTFTNNGGTVLTVEATATTVRNCTFENNKGRAIYAHSFLDYNDTASLTVENSRFIGNSTTSTYSNAGGGAIYCYYYYSPATITGCTFTGNTSAGYGGALWLHSDEAKISGCTFTENSANWGGGAIYVQNIEDRTPVLGGTIIAENNTAGGVENNIQLDGSRSTSAYITVDSTFNAAKSHVGISAYTIPSLAVKGTTNTAGFFADNTSYTLRSTTDKSGPLLTSGNTGLELWHNGEGHTHCVCGTGKNTADSDHTHNKAAKWIGVTTLKDLPEGNYYLLKNISGYPYGAPWAPVGNSNLCLNGYTYTIETGNYAPGVVVGKGVNASITDCSEEGTGKFTGTSGHQGVSVTSGGTFTLWRGSLSNFKADSSSYSSSDYRYGGGAYVKGTFVMNGGTITGCTATGGNGGGVYVADGTFLMNAGSITGCSTKTNSTSGIGNGGGVYGLRSTITINGGSITGNTATNGGGLYTSYCVLTIDGTPITGNTATGNGGGLYLASPKYKGNTRIESWYPAVIQNATITDNSADLGGGIYTVGAFKMSDTDITGNTATTNGGGLYSNVYTTYTQDGWVNDLSSKMNISGNKVGESANNLYLANGSKLPSVAGLSAGSTIGVTTEKDTLQGETIVPVYITSDAGNTDYFTSDKGYDVKLDDKNSQLYIIAQAYTVDITLGKGMTSDGKLSQNILKAAGSAMTDVVVKASDGYYFPEGYGFTQNGITVTHDSLGQITISGTPSADVTLTLPDATKKGQPDAPTGLQGVSPTGWTAKDGQISGTTTAMEWSTDPESTEWNPCSDTATTVGAEGTYYVRIKATDTAYASEATEVEVPRYLKPVDFPEPDLKYNYDGTVKTLFVPGEGYDIDGDIKATNAGKYSVTLTLKDGYKWTTEPTSTTIEWLIIKRKAQATDFTFKAPTNLVWDGTAKAADITVNAPMTLGGSNLTVVYKMNDEEVAEPTNPGIYKVCVRILGDGTGKGNFMPIDSLTADTWTFEITHPAEHDWGNWQHSDTEHYRTCTVPGCTAEERTAHETDTPATCNKKAVCTVCAAEYGNFDVHNHTGEQKYTAAKAPTCGANGNKAYYYCAACDKYYSGEADDKELYDDADKFVIPALTHKNAKKTAAVAATCEVGGNEAYWYCADCGNYYADKDGKLDSTTAYANNKTFLKDALGHDYEGQPYKSDATGHWQVCKRDGCTQETAHQAHSGNEATCVSESKCKTCNYKLADKDPNNHVIADKTEAKAATCTVGGNLAYWHCADCGKYFADKNGEMDSSKAYDSNKTFLLDKLDHDFTEKIADAAHLKAAATCTKAAEYYYDCTRCDEHSTDKFFTDGTSLGHDFTEKLADDAHLKNAATCTEAAVYYYDCTRCNVRSTSDTYSAGNPLGHNYTREVVDVAHLKNAATCTKGAEYVYTCSRCDDHNTNKTFVNGNPLGHDFTEEVVNDAHLKSAANCTKAAEYFYDCSRCDEHSTDKYFSNGNPLGHDFTEKLPDKDHLKTAATCTDPEEYYYDCTRCDVRSTSDTYSDGNPLGHKYTNYVYNNDATYDADGTETAACDHDCGKTDTRTKEGSKLIDSEAPVVKGVENGKTYCQSVEITITDVNLESVKLNGEIVAMTDSGKLTVAAKEGEQTLVATDRFGNVTTVTFKVNTEHTSDDGVVTTEPTTSAEGVKTFTCTVCGKELRTEVIAKLNPDNARTGDSTPIAVWILLSAVCALGALSALVVLRGRKRRNG